jgi:aspartate/methionine/tyrosine aminotransferase
MRDLAPHVGTASARREERGFRDKDPFFERLSQNGCSILTNPHHIDTREQSLKDTWFGFYRKYCCNNSLTHDGKPLRNKSSGNFPLYFPNQRISEVKKAMTDAMEDSGAYMHGMSGLRAEVAAYYGISPHHLFFCAGISDGIEMIHKVFLNNTKARVLIPNESYPTHFSTATTFGGKDLIVTFGRNPATGLPDLEAHTNGHNIFSQVGFSSFIPYDNPNPIVYPESFFRNDRGTGVFDLNEAAFMKDGVLRPVVIDNIYESFSWPAQHLRVQRLIELADGKNILIFLNSLSKVFMEPNKKAGVLAVHIPRRLNKYAEGSIIRDFESDFDRRLCPVSYSSVRGIVAAYRMLAIDQGPQGPHPELEAIRAEGRRRFIGEDGKGGNQAAMCAVLYIKPLHPELKIESSGYNLFKVDAPDLPWKSTEYKKEVLGRLAKVIAEMDEEERKEEAANAFEYYMKNIDAAALDPSDIFCLDLVMSTGVAYAPAGRFYKLGTSPDVVAFRPVMVAETEQFREDAKLVEQFLLERLTA